MAHDGSIVFKTQIDNSDVAKELKETENQIKQSQRAISRSEDAKLPLVKQAEELGAKLAEAKTRLQYLKDEMAAIDSAMQPGSDIDAYTDAWLRLPEVKAALEAQQKEVDKLEKKWDSVNSRLDVYNTKIRNAQTAIQENTVKAGQLQTQMNQSINGQKMAAAFDTARESAKRFENRILSIGKQVLVFSLVSKALQGVVGYMNKALNANSEYTAQLAKLKGALLTAFQPIYEFVLPGIIAVLKVLTAIAQAVAYVMSLLTGKSLEQSALNAKALNNQISGVEGVSGALDDEAKSLEDVGEAAKEAKKQLMGFDEINTLNADDSDSGGNVGDTGIGSTGIGGGGGVAGGIPPDFSDFNTDEYKQKIDELTVYLCGALLALGAILAFSGANIPLGIALMAAGAIGLAAVVKENWGAMSDGLKTAITNVALILGGAALVIGAILAFSGADIPKGIALMVLGAAALAGAAALNKDSIVEAVKGPMGKIVALVSGALLVIGLVLAFSGANLALGIALIAVGAAGLAFTGALNWNTIVTSLRGPMGETVAQVSGMLLALGCVLAFSGVAPSLGIALIAAGAVGLVTVGALNWNSIKEKLQGVWEGIKQWFKTSVAPKLTLSYWQEKFSNIAEGLKQKVKDGVNSGIALLNSFISWVNSALLLQWGGFTAFGETIIPAGSFQLLTIPQIPYLAQGAVIPPNAPFMAVLGDQRNGNNIEAPEDLIRRIVREESDSGDTAELAALLETLIETVQDIRVGDEVIGRAAARYQRKTSRAMGG